MKSTINILNLNRKNHEICLFLFVFRYTTEIFNEIRDIKKGNRSLDSIVCRDIHRQTTTLNVFVKKSKKNEH